MNQRSSALVTSEVGRLRRALVHEPGPEIDGMVPRMMEELLFDDILHGERARDEHRRFRRILQLLGVEALEALTLLSETVATEEGRGWVEERVLPHLIPEFQERLRAMPADEMARSLVQGVRRSTPESGPTLDDLFGIRPLPNWCFQRDTQVVLGEGVLFTAMASIARRRETLLSRAIFHFHPELSAIPVLAEIAADDVPADPFQDAPEGRPLSLEGGDVLVLSPEVVAVGHSERTTHEGIEALVEALAGRERGPRWLLRVELPRERAYMHLDTLFTPVGPDAALVFAPIILPGHPGTAETWEYDLHESAPVPVARGNLLGALARYGLDYHPILCGGVDPMDQQREQWTDGANALAVAPYLVILYDRNVRTAEAMDDAGYRVVRADDLLLGAQELGVGEKACILIPSNELSRARGGPHCLTHPLLRDPL